MNYDKKFYKLTYKVGEIARPKKCYNTPLHKSPVPSTGRDRDKRRNKRKRMGYSRP